ncbi:MAG: hypothetical protein U0936_01065 [Planctomycetaceae bacterium]
MKYLKKSFAACSKRASLILCVSAICMGLSQSQATAQDSAAPSNQTDKVGRIADGSLGDVTGEATSSTPPTEAKSFTKNVSDELVRLGIPQPLPFLWDLAVQGGLFMIPIALCSSLLSPMPLSEESVSGEI